jgi:hypothetical protein
MNRCVSRPTHVFIKPEKNQTIILHSTPLVTKNSILGPFDDYFRIRIESLLESSPWNPLTYAHCAHKPILIETLRSILTVERTNKFTKENLCYFCQQPYKESLVVFLVPFGGTRAYSFGRFKKNIRRNGK